jgi:hypothetical protein
MMKNLLSSRNILAFSMTLAMILVSAFNAPQALAAGNTFNLEVKHSINGNDLGLPKALPVNVYVNGNLTIENFTFGETVSTSLPAGRYQIKVTLLDGTPLPSMDVGPVSIPSGVDVDINARLNYKGTPILQVLASESKPVVKTFKVEVEHDINGYRLGLPEALPVNVYINGALAIPGFEYGDKVSTNLAAGTYTITVKLLDGTPLPSMTVGPVFIESGSDVYIKAKLDFDKTPFLNVRFK